MKNKQTKESSDAGSLAKKIDKEPLIKKMIAVIEVPEVLKQETTDPSTIEELPLLNPLEITTSVVIEEDKKPIFDSQVAELPQLQVQITYKADASPSVLEEDKTRVGKLLAKARQIRPGEMLASIRETKNDFFNGKKN